MSNPLVVYTVLTDTRFRVQPPNPSVDAEHVCLYAGDKPEAPGWRTIRFFPPEELCKSRASRIPKALPHRFFDDSELSIYVDSTVSIRDNVNDFISRAIEGKHIGLVSLSRPLSEEFQRVESRRYEDLYTLRSQESEYLSTGLGLRELTTFWGGLIFRRHNEESVIKFGERWILNILRFSRRDQLSLPVALREIDHEHIIIVDGDDEKSDLHYRLKGVAKDISYTAGSELKLTLKATVAKTREEWLVEEIGSLRSHIRARGSMISLIRIRSKKIFSTLRLRKSS